MAKDLESICRRLPAEEKRAYVAAVNAVLNAPVEHVRRVALARLPRLVRARTWPVSRAERDGKRRRTVSARVSVEEYARYERAAQSAGMSLYAFVREALRSATIEGA